MDTSGSMTEKANFKEEDLEGFLSVIMSFKAILQTQDQQRRHNEMLVYITTEQHAAL